MDVIKEFIHEFLLGEILDLVDSLSQLSYGLLAVDLEHFDVVGFVDFGQFLFIFVDNFQVFDKYVLQIATNILMLVKDIFGCGEFDEWQIGSEKLQYLETFIVVVVNVRKQLCQLLLVVVGVSVMNSQLIDVVKGWGFCYLRVGKDETVCV